MRLIYFLIFFLLLNSSLRVMARDFSVYLSDVADGEVCSHS